MIGNQIKNGIIHGIVFFITVGFLSIGYAEITNVWTNTDTLEVSSGSILSSTNWNKLLGNFEFLKSKTENIFSNGVNVGIGTESPGTKLGIKGNTGLNIVDDNGESYLRAWNCAAEGACLVLYKDGGVNRAAEIRGDGNHTYFNDGNVGIGTSTPSEKLEVSGGNVKMGYEIVTSGISAGAAIGWYYIDCPNGKYAIGGACTTGGGDTTGTNILSNSYGCYKNSTSTNWQIQVVCANIR